MYDKGDYQALNKYISEIKWEKILKEKSTNQMWNEIKAKMELGSDKYIPT